MISIIESQENWRDQLAEFKHYDFYHTFDYHRVSQKNDEVPVLFLYQNGDQKIVIPFLKRAIAGTSLHDLVSVYGYVGPLTLNLQQPFDNRQFTKEFSEVLQEMGIVSLFSRLHPYLPMQESVVDSLGQIVQLGRVVNIDLTVDLAVQRQKYGKSTKNRTNKCRRLCRVESVNSDEALNTFVDIYYENMDRLGAGEDYYFPREYFFEFYRCLDFETEVLLVTELETNQVIAGSMFVKTKEMIQFHLSGTRTNFLKLAPANLFLDEMRVRGTEQGFKFFNLGGGLGSREDSLFEFKASFSNDFRNFKIWKFIVNDEVYQKLARERHVNLSQDYFPLYRAPVNSPIN